LAFFVLVAVFTSGVRPVAAAFCVRGAAVCGADFAVPFALVLALAAELERVFGVACVPAARVLGALVAELALRAAVRLALDR
jgi:hypothetical protein